jgi:hypothetical protein
MRLCQKLEGGQYRLTIGLQVEGRLSLLFGTLALPLWSCFRGDKANEPAPVTLAADCAIVVMIEAGLAAAGQRGDNGRAAGL